jgi:hypothetical protein
MDNDSLEHRGNICILEHALLRMRISTWAVSIANSDPSPQSPLFMNMPELLQNERPPPLCECGQDVCVCSFNDHAQIPVPCLSICACSCHNHEVTVVSIALWTMHLIIGQVCDRDQLTLTHKVILSAVEQLQCNTRYSAIPLEVQEWVLKNIYISQDEYM